MDALPRAEWIDRFAMALSALGVRAEPQHVSDLATEAWETQGAIDPLEAAQAAWNEWPPHDD